MHYRDFINFYKGQKVKSTVPFDHIPRIQQDIPHVVSSSSFTYDEWLKMGEIAEELEKYNLKAKNHRILSVENGNIISDKLSV